MKEDREGDVRKWSGEDTEGRERMEEEKEGNMIRELKLKRRWKEGEMLVPLRLSPTCVSLIVRLYSYLTAYMRITHVALIRGTQPNSRFLNPKSLMPCKMSKSSLCSWLQPDRVQCFHTLKLRLKTMTQLMIESTSKKG